MRPIVVATSLSMALVQSAAIAGDIECSPSGDFLECSLPGSVEMNFRLIEPGSLIWGDPDSSLFITESYYIGTTEITQAQWAAVMEETPWADRGNVGTDDHGRYPATYILWNDLDKDNTDSFPAAWRGMGSGYEARLPNQVEWEYACRAGTITPFSFGDDFDGDFDMFADRYV